MSEDQQAEKIAADEEATAVSPRKSEVKNSGLEKQRVKNRAKKTGSKTEGQKTEWQVLVFHQLPSEL